MDQNLINQSPTTVPGETDHLADAVLRSLSRSFRDQFSLSAAQAGVMGWLTVGIWPLWRLIRKFRDYTMFERQQLWHLAEWLRTRVGGDQSAGVVNQIGRLRGRRGLGIASKACALCVFVFFFIGMSHGFSLGGLLNHTWRFQHAQSSIRLDNALMLFIAWNVGLAAAYLLHWVHVQLHARDLRRVIERFNGLAVRQDMQAITMPDSGSLRISWVILSVILCSIGGFWSIPMSLAAAAQRRYINHTAMHARGDLLDRVRTMLRQHRPTVEVPSFVIHGRRCDNNACRAPLKAGGRYCSRCGSSADRLSAVA